MKTYTVQKESAWRVSVDDNTQILIIGDQREGESYYDFYKTCNDCGQTVFMFGLNAATVEEAISIAMNNADLY